MYTVEFHKKALKDLDQIPKTDLQAIKDKVWSLKETPRPKGCKKLSGHKSTYHIRVGMYKIVYKVDDKCITVLVLAIRHRKDVYKGF